MQELTEPRHDEQRVVDTDAQPDHRDEKRRDRVDIGQPRKEEQEEERGCDGCDGEGDRDRSGHERAEDDEQHDQGREQAEQLLRSLLDGRELRVAVVLHGHARGLDRLADRVLDGNDLVAILGVDHAVELGLRIRDAPVVGDRVRRERILDALEAGLVLRGLELGPAELRDRFVDRLLPLGRVEPLPRGSSEDDVEHTTLLFGEFGLDQIGCLLRVGPWDLELVAKGSSERDDEDDEHGEDAEPGADNAPRVRGATPRPARERTCRKAFVPCSPLRALRHLTSSRRVRSPIDEF